MKSESIYAKGCQKLVQNANNFIANEGYIEGDYLLKNELDPYKREIKLIYGGKTIDEPERKRLLKRKNIYGLHKATLVIQQGFSITDVTKDLTQAERYQAEINRLKSELSLNIRKQDSVATIKKTDSPLYREIKPLFPEVSYCSADKQIFYTDSSKTRHYTVVVLGSKNPRKTTRDVSRINNWLKVRLKSDSIKVYVEKSTF